MIEMMTDIDRKAIVLSPEEIDDKIKYCIKLGGRSGGKRAFYTRLAVLAEIQRNQKGGKLWPFIVMPKSTRSAPFTISSSDSAPTVRLMERLEK